MCRGIQCATIRVGVLICMQYRLEENVQARAMSMCINSAQRVVMLNMSVYGKSDCVEHGLVAHTALYMS